MRSNEKLKEENKELKKECEFLSRMLKEERRFFLESLKHNTIEEYRTSVQVNKAHQKELLDATQ